MATHSSVLAWRIPGTGEPCGLPSMGSHRVGHDSPDLAAAAGFRKKWFWTGSPKPGLAGVRQGTGWVPPAAPCWLLLLHLSCQQEARSCFRSTTKLSHFQQTRFCFFIAQLIWKIWQLFKLHFQYGLRWKLCIYLNKTATAFQILPCVEALSIHT